jgi:hypothetical protein
MSSVGRFQKIASPVFWGDDVASDPFGSCFIAAYAKNKENWDEYIKDITHLSISTMLQMGIRQYFPNISSTNFILKNYPFDKENVDDVVKKALKAIENPLYIRDAIGIFRPANEVADELGVDEWASDIVSKRGYPSGQKIDEIQKKAIRTKWENFPFLERFDVHSKNLASDVAKMLMRYAEPSTIHCVDIYAQPAQIVSDQFAQWKITETNSDTLIKNTSNMLTRYPRLIVSARVFDEFISSIVSNDYRKDAFMEVFIPWAKAKMLYVPIKYSQSLKKKISIPRNTRNTKPDTMCLERVNEIVSTIESLELNIDKAIEDLDTSRKNNTAINHYRMESIKGYAEKVNQRLQWCGKNGNYSQEFMEKLEKRINEFQEKVDYYENEKRDYTLFANKVLNEFSEAVKTHGVSPTEVIPLLGPLSIKARAAAANKLGKDYIKKPLHFVCPDKTHAKMVEIVTKHKYVKDPMPFNEILALSRLVIHHDELLSKTVHSRPFIHSKYPLPPHNGYGADLQDYVESLKPLSDPHLEFIHHHIGNVNNK